MSDTTDDKTNKQHSLVMQHTRDELQKFVKDMDATKALPDGNKSPDARAAAVQNLLQVVHATWSQLHQAEFNREMAATQRGSSLALPR